MPISGLAYFFEVSYGPINEHFIKNKERIKRAETTRGIRQFGFGKACVFLTYRISSQIYEARDLGFTRDETII